MFTAYPSYFRYRTLKLSSPHLHGEDVFALQTALIGIGFALSTFGADGDLGKETFDVIREAQGVLTLNGQPLTVDGLAGGQTQEALARKLASGSQKRHSLPAGLLRGQIEHESGFRLGNYSPVRVDGTYDAGVCQRNTKQTPPQDGFKAPESIEKLASDVRSYYDKFAGVSPVRRRWELAQGAWNAPAYASFIAKEEGATGQLATARPSAEARATLEAYIDSVSAYLSV